MMFCIKKKENHLKRDLPESHGEVNTLHSYLHVLTILIRIVDTKGRQMCRAKRARVSTTKGKKGQ